MKNLINENIDTHGNVYRLWVELKNSSLKDHVDVEFYSTYTGSKNPDNKQTKWKTTLPRGAFISLMAEFNDFYNFQMHPKNL